MLIAEIHEYKEEIKEENNYPDTRYVKEEELYEKIESKITNINEHPKFEYNNKIDIEESDNNSYCKMVICAVVAVVLWEGGKRAYKYISPKIKRLFQNEKPES